MRRHSRTHQAVCLFLFFMISGPADAMNLKEVYEKALESAARVQDRKLSVQIAEERKSQGYARVLPTINAQSDNVWRDQANVGAFGEGYQRTSYLALSQPIFQGGSEYFSVKIAQSLPEIARLEKANEELVVFVDISRIFYEILKLKQIDKTYQEQEAALEKRVQTLIARARIGRNKQTDVLAAQSQLARTKAERVQIESQIVEMEQMLLNQIGLESVPELKDEVDIAKLEPSPAWETSLMEVPMIRAAELTLKNTERLESAATGTFLPSVDLGANYYLERAGILRESEWDVTINARWNLFSGGNDLAEKRVQNLEAKRLEAYLIENKRNLKKNYEALKKEFQIQKQVVLKLQSAVELAQKNYQQHVKEESQGLVNQLDVLRVLEEYIQVKRNYDQQYFTAKQTWSELQATAGVRP